MNATPDGALTSKRSWQFSMRSVVLFTGVCCLLFAAAHYFALPRLAEAHDAALRHQCVGNLKRIAIALNAYETAYGSYPPAYVTDANGKPLYSWRVLILPQLGRSDIYDSLHLSEPWNSSHNTQFAMQDVVEFRCPANNSGTRGIANYVAVVGPETMWPGSKSLGRSDISDGAMNTLMVVEVDDANICWMEPRDLEFSKMNMKVNASKSDGISSSHIDRAIVVWASGVTSGFRYEIDPDVVRAALTVSGGEGISGPDEL